MQALAGSDLCKRLGRLVVGAAQELDTGMGSAKVIREMAL